MACAVTFSPFIAADDNPMLGIIRGFQYWISDQTFNGDKLLGFEFIQQANDTSVTPNRYAGNVYLKFYDCQAACTRVAYKYIEAATGKEKYSSVPIFSICSLDFVGGYASGTPGLHTETGNPPCLCEITSDVHAENFASSGSNLSVFGIPYSSACTVSASYFSNINCSSSLVKDSSTNCPGGTTCCSGLTYERWYTKQFALNVRVGTAASPNQVVITLSCNTLHNYIYELYTSYPICNKRYRDLDIGCGTPPGWSYSGNYANPSGASLREKVTGYYNLISTPVWLAANGGTLSGMPNCQLIMH